MYSEAVRNEATLRDEMLLIGTHYLQKFKDKGVADRAAVLEDLFQSEAAFYESLKLVLDVYVECYEHCTDEQSQKRLAQTMTTLMARRPVLDLNLPYLSDSYASEVVAVQLEATLLREILSAQTLEERLYRNTIAVRHAQLLDQERIGFPGAVFQPVTNDHLRGGQPIYYPTPGSLGVAVLDVYHSLESVAGVQDVLKAVLKEMVFIHRLQPGAMLTAMKTVVLQQALIEWRLLMEEEDMTEELSKKTGDEISRRPYANNFVIDDPFAIDDILDQVQAQFEYEAEQEEKTKQASSQKSAHSWSLLPL